MLSASALKATAAGIIGQTKSQHPPTQELYKLALCNMRLLPRSIAPSFEIEKVYESSPPRPQATTNSVAAFRRGPVKRETKAALRPAPSAASSGGARASARWSGRREGAAVLRSGQGSLFAGLLIRACCRGRSHPPFCQQLLCAPFRARVPAFLHPSSRRLATRSKRCRPPPAAPCCSVALPALP
jgi:hypothetical protein